MVWRKITLTIIEEIGNSAWSSYVDPSNRMCAAVELNFLSSPSYQHIKLTPPIHSSAERNTRYPNPEGDMRLERQPSGGSESEYKRYVAPE